MQRALAVVAVLGSAGCETTVDPASLTCVEIAAILTVELGETSRACDSPNECELFGVAVDKTGSESCEGTIAFASDCNGDAVNRAAWTARDDLVPLQDEWYARCVPLGPAAGVVYWFDCRPGPVSCVEHVCLTTSDNCLPQGAQ